MKRLLLIFVGIFLTAFGAPNAYAGLMFGTGEHIRFVANITVPGPAGEKLYLARKITMHSFIAPYSVSDDGFVLGISGEPKKYYPLPDPSKLKLLQTTGYLPDPLPTWELSLFDRLFGNALWLLIVGFIGYFGIKKLLKNGRNA